MASETSKESVEITERDIVFDCPHCSGELVVDKDGAGMTFDCSHCSKSVTVPQASTVRGAVAKPAEEAVAESKHEEPPKEGAPAEPAPPKSFDFSSMPREQVEKRLAELKLQYKENSSQRTEIRGYINRAQIELHRYQLRLQKLVDRQADMEGEIRAAQSFLGPPQP